MHQWWVEGMESIQYLGKREGELILVLKVQVPPQLSPFLTVQQFVERYHLRLEYVEAILCNVVAKCRHYRFSELQRLNKCQLIKVIIDNVVGDAIKGDDTSEAALTTRATR